MNLEDHAVGTSAIRSLVIDKPMVLDFANLVNDFAPAHFDEKSAKSRGFDREIVHGFLLSSLVSGLLGQELPGNDFVINEVKLKFRQPVYVGDTINCQVTVDKIVRAVSAVVLSIAISREGDVEPSVTGTAICSAPELT